MPSLPNQKIFAEAADGTQFKATVPASVTTTGEFSVGVPTELESIAFRLLPNYRAGRVSIAGRRNDAPRVRSKTLGEAVQFVNACAKEYVEVEAITERVIIYSMNIKVSFWLNDDGSLSPNGALGKNGGQWWKGKLAKSLHSSDRSRYAEVGLIAAVYDRKSFKRSTGTTYVWERVDDRHDAPRDIRELNGFHAHYFDPQLHGFKIMPYTPEAARFFTRMILGICKIGKCLDEFFSSEEAMEEAIKTGSLPLLGYKS